VLLAAAGQPLRKPAQEGVVGKLLQHSLLEGVFDAESEPGSYDKTDDEADHQEQEDGDDLTELHPRRDVRRHRRQQRQ
jgi:hypothetical protein